MSTRVVHMRQIDKPNTVRIDRKTKWGNPFVIGKDGSRSEVIAKYKEYIKHRGDLLAELNELKGKNLACWCKPLPCHGDVLVELIEKMEE